MPKTDLKTLSKQELESFTKEAGLPAFRSKQLLHWIYERYARSVADISEFSRELRDRLAEKAYISNLEVIKRVTDEDGTEKFLFGLEDGESIESVLIPDNDRLTLCISSQVGCAMNCRFCLTGSMGIVRHLLPHEIVDQVISVSRLRKNRPSVASPGSGVLTNIVFMGMGEPLANFDNVVAALRRITGLMKISPGRITVSTSGIVPKIPVLALEAPKVKLAVSLNATTDSGRDRIMPVNRTYPLRSLLDACRKFPLPPRSRITFEYVLLKGVNDTPEDAIRLARLIKGIPSKVNLIPFNACPGSEFRSPSEKSVLLFQDILVKAHLTALVRKSRGQGISAACGQLKANYEK